MPQKRGQLGNSEDVGCRLVVQHARIDFWYPCKESNASERMR
jgi:hypothetical protein